MVLRRRLIVGFLTAFLCFPLLAQGFSGGEVAAATNPFAGVQWLRNDIDLPVTKKANEWRNSRPGDAALLDVVANEQSADWITQWLGNSMEGWVDYLVKKYTRAGSVPILVPYNVPNLNCNTSGGNGASTPDAYRAWITRFVRATGTSKVVVILEPDGLTHTDCGIDLNARYALIGEAVDIIKRNNPNAFVYIDGGDSNRNTVAEITKILNAANIARADGFFLNATVYQYTTREVAYGEAVSAQVGGKHFVVDTSRNGLGPGNEDFCNARGRALGIAPTTATGSSAADAFIWIKRVWESDETCGRGDPGGGQNFFDFPGTPTENFTQELVSRSIMPFRDMPSDPETAQAVRALTLRGVIRGNLDGTFGPNSTTLRGQMAALLTRPFSFELDNRGNKFPDRCDAGNCVDDNLWRNVGALASYIIPGTLPDYRVANGYEDGTYNPRGEVLYGQTILFISRAMVYKGYWRLQPDNPAYITNITAPDARKALDRQFMVTYINYTQGLGGIPGQASPATFAGHELPAPRSFFALALYRALKTVPGYLP